MKRLTALVIALLLCVAPALADSAAESTRLAQVRYHFEHSALPRYFYDDPANMLDVLGEKGVFPLWKALADENGAVYPYGAGDFGEHWYDLEDSTTILQIEMPDPEVTPLCYRIYMVYNPGTGDAHYFTVEYDDLLGETAILCGWTNTQVHVEYGGAAILDKADPDYGKALYAEAEQVAALAGASFSMDGGSDETNPPASDTGLVEIRCPELGFSTMADPAYSWDYQEGTGISIYTQGDGHIPYVIVWQSEDLIAEPYEYIVEQYTPYMEKKYGDNLVYYQEYESYSLGGKQLPAGVYTYRLQGVLIDLIRAYDSTGERTVAYTAKYIQGEAEPTLSALHDAIRYFRAE